MQTTEVRVQNKLGLHARAAAKLVQVASQYSASIKLQREKQCVNGKSIMGVMMLAASQGTELILAVDGEDEADATQALTNLFNNRFGETD